MKGRKRKKGKGSKIMRKRKEGYGEEWISKRGDMAEGKDV